MSTRSWPVISFALLFFAGCLASTLCEGQIRELRNADASSLIDDLPRPTGKDQGRFQVVSIVSHTFLLDSSTGETWVLNIDAEDDTVTWVEVPRLPHKKKAPAEEREPEKKPKGPMKNDFDPFG